VRFPSQHVSYGRLLCSGPRSPLLLGCGAFPCGEEGGRFDEEDPLDECDPLELGLFVVELYCAVFELFAELVGTVLLLIALGGRSLRFAALLTVLFPLFPGLLAEIALADGGRFAFAAAFAATTPFPLNTPGLALAATVGCP